MQLGLVKSVIVIPFTAMFPLSEKECTGASVLLEFARTRDIDYIFCSPIAVMAPLWESLADRETGPAKATSPRYLNCRHELLAVSLASGYTKVMGKPQMVFLPVGLGVLNGSMGIRSALQVCFVHLSPHTYHFSGKNPYAYYVPRYNYVRCGSPC